MKKWMYNTLIIIFASVFLISAFFLGKYYLEAYQQKNRYNALSDIRGNAPTTPRPALTEDPTAPTVAPTEPEFVDVVDPDTGKTVTLLPEFAELYQINNDIVGWINIPGTDIDYPVMQTPDQQDYYLNRNFDKEYSSRGCIYAREVCDIFAPSDNITLYGHRMRDRSMFAQLDEYTYKAFYDNNPYIYFDTIKELHTYQIVAVLTTTSSVGEGFSYHAFVDAKDQAEFDSFINTCKQLSLYDTGVTAEYGDKLITLSTCEYTHVNGRLVIVAKRIA